MNFRIRFNKRKIFRKYFFSSLEIYFTIVFGGRFPGGPVGPYGAGAEPLAVHQGDRVLSLHLLHEGYEPVALGLQGLGVSHYTAVPET